MGQTLGYPSKKDQCIDWENTCTVGISHDILFQRQPRGDYRVIEGNCFYKQYIQYKCINTLIICNIHFMKYNEHLVHFKIVYFPILLFCFYNSTCNFYLSSVPLGNMLIDTYCLVIIKIFHVYRYIFLYIYLYVI